MKIKYFFLGALAMCMAACSTNETDEVIANQGAAYMQLSVALPSASSTRSQTSGTGTTAEGVEVGQVTENKVSSISVVLVSESGTKQQFFVPQFSASTDGTVYTSEPFQVSDITASTDYTVYAIVNGGMAFSDAATDFVQVASANLSGSIAKPNNFLMTGVKSEVVTTGDDLTVYTKENPLDLQTIDVERAVARFDYKEAKTSNIYQLSPASSGNEVYVTLTDMALLNVSKDFYLFKRVSVDGTSTGWTINGKETSSNYVVDYNWANKTAAAVVAAEWDPSTYFYNAIGKGETPTYFSLTGEYPTDNSWSGVESSGGLYKIVTYATENTIQAEPSNQVNGISTGVIFKGKLTGTKFINGDNVYVLNNKVIGNWSDVFACEDADVVNARAGLSPTEAGNTNAQFAAAGFSRFTPDDNGVYNVYYYYWNRHNDNQRDNVMGIMEFGVVRNNVYKLSVTDITKIGHPNDPTFDPDDDPDNPGNPDPDPINPIDPDENSDIYLKVAVKVLPWTVRKNDITF